jgi:hypothetical protein
MYSSKRHNDSFSYYYKQSLREGGSGADFFWGLRDRLDNNNNAKFVDGGGNDGGQYESMVMTSVVEASVDDMAGVQGADSLADLP